MTILATAIDRNSQEFKDGDAKLYEIGADTSANSKHIHWPRVIRRNQVNHAHRHDQD